MVDVPELTLGGVSVDDLPPEPEGSVILPGGWTGPPLSPMQHVTLYSPDEWEQFIFEWARELRGDYLAVKRLSGSGDKGIDIAGILSREGLNGEWHCFQCKHYGSSLTPTTAYPEIAKILHNSLTLGFNLPTKYLFLAPRDCGPSLERKLLTPDDLKKDFLENLDKAARPLKLNEAQVSAIELLAKSVDFSIFGSESLEDVLAVHASSRHHARRFGGPLPERPKVEDPPPNPLASENRYIWQLLEVYEEKYGISSPSHSVVSANTHSAGHYRRQREAFYSAESLRAFARDTVPHGTYEALKEDLFDGVIETHDQAFPLGMDRLTSVLEAAVGANFTANVLLQRFTMRDRRGMCHQLANEDRLTWCRGGGGATT